MAFSKPMSRILWCQGRQSSQPSPRPWAWALDGSLLRVASPVGFVQNQPPQPIELDVLCGFYMIHQASRGGDEDIDSFADSVYSCVS